MEFILTASLPEMGSFRAASESGIYLAARPNPFIDAEVAAGGFPEWTLWVEDPLR
ncbi:hypothetical protein QR685DRAFT_550743 [Neurospora intermedia]|uniref:Glycoside hydrolase 35 catalytic domain-containing protein n=1 Tax=Neurospora intermedia TaxID=5142 RepID=A0ABR3DJ89_NEUIN